MTPLLGLILLVLIAYGGTLFLQKIRLPTSLLIKSFIESGIIYLLLGYIIGPKVLTILDEKILEDVSIMLSFILGWTGFLIGLQIGVKQMLRFPINYYWRALSNFCFTFLLIFIGLLTINYFLKSFFSLTELLLLTTATSINSSFFIGLLKKEFKIRGNLIHFMQFQAGYDNMLGIIITGIAMMGIQINVQSSSLEIATNFALSLLVVIVLAFIFFYIAKNLKSVQQFFLIIIGFILFLVGTAMHLGQSSLFVSFIFGIVLANLPLKTWKLFQTIVNAEKPIYLLLLIFMGASVSNVDFLFVALAFVLSIWRLAGKYLSAKLTLYHFDHEKNFSSLIGLSGVGIGGLSLALVIDYHLSVNTIGGETILLILAILFLINDTVSLKIVQPLLRREKG